MEQKACLKRIDSVVLKKVNPYDVSQYYPLIADAVVAGLLGPESPTAPVEVLASRVMSMIANKQLECWALLAEGDAKDSFIGAITTYFHDDIFRRCRALVIAGGYTSQVVTKHAWESVYRVFEAYAKQNGCSKMVTYTKLPHLIRMYEGFGANADMREVVKEL